MFEIIIQQIWTEWFNKNKPKKIKWLKYLIAAVIVIIAGFVALSFSKAGGVLIFIGFIILISISCKVSGASLKACRSAAEFCWNIGLYDTGRNKSFPFMPIYASEVLGGKIFQYSSAEVILYDTVYLGKNHSPGILIEITPKYSIGSGNIEWIKGKASVPEFLGVDENIILCIERIINYQHNKMQNPKCRRNNDSFYIYAALSAIGLIVDESGQLYPDTMLNPQGHWHSADEILEIIDSCFGKRLE
ncbi:MAG: hypothetical protein ACLU8Q_03470 [Oscillospiraceae bacterium]|jgi:hypothetical protein